MKFLVSLLTYAIAFFIDIYTSVRKINPLRRHSQARAAVSLYGRTTALALLGSCVVIAPMTGCTQADVDGTLNKIAARLPGIQAAADSAGAVVSAVDPALVVPVTAALAIINSGLPELRYLITQYTANPSATVLARIQALINDFVTNGSSALFAAAHITDVATQQKITQVLAFLVAPLQLLDALIQQIETPSTIKANAAARTVKLATIGPYLDHNQMNQLALANGTTYAAYLKAQTSLGF